MCIIISMVEPLFYLTQAFAIRRYWDYGFFSYAKDELRSNQQDCQARLCFDLASSFFLLDGLQPIFPNEVT
jgi:hypothetical protein